jgi:hypothetical protein
MQQRRLGELLISKGLISEAQHKEALEEHTTTGEFLGIILVRQQSITERVLTETLSEQFHLPVVALEHQYLNWELIRRFSSSLVLDHRCLPVSEDTWSITFAVVNPLDAWAISRSEDEARPLRVKIALTYPHDMDNALSRYRQYLKGVIEKQ